MCQSSELMLNAYGLTKHYGEVRALDGVDFQVAKGEAVGIIGQNGSGKSSLLRALTRSLDIDGGTIEFLQRDISRELPYRLLSLGIAYMSQNSRLVESLNVYENVAMGSYAASGGLHVAAPDEDNIRRALRIVDCERIAERPIHGLTYLERRLAELARTLVSKPKLLLLDEPTSGLALNEREYVVSLLLQLRDGIRTLILIEHALSVVEAVCERVIVMNSGRVIRKLPAHALRQSSGLLFTDGSVVNVGS